MSGWLLAFASLVSLVVGVVCGLIPALRLSREQAVGALTETARATTGKRGRRLQRGLVIAQISIGTVLMTAMVATFIGYARLHGVAPGFDASSAITMSVSTSGVRYRDPLARVALLDALLARARAMPGVRSAATTNILPLGGGIMSANYEIVGVTSTDSAALRTAPVRSISDGYFATLGIPLVRGRAILSSDDATTPLVAVVNDAFARQLAVAVGARIRISSPMVDTGTVTIVGVAANTKELGLTGDDAPMIYLAARQSPFPYNNFVIRTDGASRLIVTAMRAELGRLDADLAVDEVANLSNRVSAAYALQAFGLTVVGAFALLAALLVALGVFAVTSGQVTIETRSIGVRMALGASPGRVQRDVLVEGLQLAALGSSLGIVASIAFRGAIGAIARDATALDTPAIGAAASVLVVIALLASWVPALRASRTDPKIALTAD
jgi:predicted permease